jgi:hypothetical protein
MTIRRHQCCQVRRLRNQRQPLTDCGRRSFPSQPTKRNAASSSGAKMRYEGLPVTPALITWARTRAGLSQFTVSATYCGAAIISADGKLTIAAFILATRASGSDLNSTMRAFIGRRPDLPLLYMTGFTGFDKLDPMEQRLLKKPFTISQLVRKVNELPQPSAGGGRQNTRGTRVIWTVSADLPARPSALARTIRCPVRVHTGGNRAKPPQARKACRTTTAGSKSALCVNGAEFGSVGSLTIPCQVIGWQAPNSRISHQPQRSRHRQLPQQNLPVADIGATPRRCSPCVHRLRHEAAQ